LKLCWVLLYNDRMFSFLREYYRPESRNIDIDSNCPDIFWGRCRSYGDEAACSTELLGEFNHGPDPNRLP